MREFEIVLELARLEYLLRPIRLAVTKDYGVLKVDGLTIELHKGIEIEVPYWLAKAIESLDVGKLTETPITLEDIARIHYTTLSARTPAELEPLPPYFYQEARDYLEALDERIRKELNPSLLEEKQKALQYLIEIVEKRLTMIIHSLRSPTSVAELYSKLTPEEQAILKSLQQLLETWRANILPQRTS
jgi:DNA replication factor GINS